MAECPLYRPNDGSFEKDPLNHLVKQEDDRCYYPRADQRCRIFVRKTRECPADEDAFKLQGMTTFDYSNAMALPDTSIERRCHDTSYVLNISDLRVEGDSSCVLGPYEIDQCCISQKFRRCECKHASDDDDESDRRRLGRMKEEMPQELRKHIEGADAENVLAVRYFMHSNRDSGVQRPKIVVLLLLDGIVHSLHVPLDMLDNVNVRDSENGSGQITADIQRALQLASGLEDPFQGSTVRKPSTESCVHLDGLIQTFDDMNPKRIYRNLEHPTTSAVLGSTVDFLKQYSDDGEGAWRYISVPNSKVEGTAQIVVQRNLFELFHQHFYYNADDFPGDSFPSS